MRTIRRGLFHRYRLVLDSVQSGGVSEGVEHPAVYSPRDFNQFSPALRRRKSFMLGPDISPDQGNGIGEGRVGLGILRGCAWHHAALPFDQDIRRQCHHTEQADQRGVVRAIARSDH